MDSIEKASVSFRCYDKLLQSCPKGLCDSFLLKMGSVEKRWRMVLWQMIMKLSKRRYLS